VAEADLVEDDALAERVERVRAGPIGDRRRQVEDLEDPLDRRGRLLHGVDDAGELAHRSVEKGHRGGEREEIAGRHRARDHLLAAVPERAHDADRRQHLHERVGDLVGAVVLEGQVEQTAVDVIESRDLVRLTPERLDDLGPREHLMKEHVELGDLQLRALVDPVEPAADRPHGDADEGKDDQRDHGEPPVAHEHDGRQRHDHHQLPDRHHQHRRGQARQPVHVRDYARHELGRVVAGEERQRHPLQVRVEVATQARDHALADRGHQVGLAVAGQPLGRVGGEEQQRDDPEHRLVAPDEYAVHGRLDEPGDRALHRGDDHREQRADDQRGQVRPQVGDEAPVEIGADVHAAVASMRRR